MAASAALQLRLIAATDSLSQDCGFAGWPLVNTTVGELGSGTSNRGPLSSLGKARAIYRVPRGVSTVSPLLACTLYTLGKELGSWR